MRFTVPEDSGPPVELQVTVTDRFAHATTATVSVSSDSSSEKPRGIPSFASFKAGDGALAGGVALGWTALEGTATYEYCTSFPFSSVPLSCSKSGDPARRGRLGHRCCDPQAARTRRGCLPAASARSRCPPVTAAGCTQPGVGPLVGGLQVAGVGDGLRLPGDGVRCPSGGDQVHDRRRDEHRGAGTTLRALGPARPATRCRSGSGPVGFVKPGATCIGLLTPRDSGHLTHLTIVGSRNGTPRTEQQIRIR